MFLNLGNGTFLNARLILGLWVPPPADPGDSQSGEPGTVFFSAAPPASLPDRRTASRLLNELAHWPGFVLLRGGRLAVNFDRVTAVTLGDGTADLTLPGYPGDLRFRDADADAIRARVRGTG
jgi:hypothetical protein